MLPPSACLPGLPDQQRPSPPGAAGARRSYTTLWDMTDQGMHGFVTFDPLWQNLQVAAATTNTGGPKG